MASREHLQQHREECRALVAERHALLQQQANLLRGYVMAGQPLPTTQKGDDVQGATEYWQRLLAQLTKEEAASHAALDALKQGCSLAMAREVGARVLRQAGELSATGTAQPAATWDRQTQLQPRSVLLSVQLPAEQDGDRAASPAARPGTVQFQTAAGGDFRAAESSSGRNRLHSAGALQSSREGSHPVSAQLGTWQAASPELTAAAPSGPAAGPDMRELQQQVAALRSAMAAQAAAASASQPWSQLLPAVTAAAALAANPAAALAMLSAGQQQQQQLMFPGGIGVPAPAGAGPADPELSAALTAHARDMALLRMEVERAKGMAELQQVRCQLAAMHQASGGAQQQTGQQQQQQQQQLVSPVAPSGQVVQQSSGPADIAADTAEDDADEPASIQHKLSDSDAWLDHLPAAAGEEVYAAESAPEDEALTAEEGSALLAARGSNADTDVLQVSIITAGPFSKRGSYRVAVVLFDGFQPVDGGPSQQVTASTSKRLVVPPGAAVPAASTPADLPSEGRSGSSSQPDAQQQGTARFAEALSLRGVKLCSTTQVVFELYLAKPGLAGLPTKELLVAWAAAPLMQNGQVLPGLQSLPLLRLPLMLTAQRKFTFDGALLDFKLTRFTGAPGDVELPGAAAAAAAGSSGARGGGGGGGQAAAEDIPGVPARAWVRVARGVPPADPYTPGDGLVVVVDGGRFLPANTTISKVVGSVWSSSGRLLAGPFEGVAQPDSDALSPAYHCSTALGVAHNNTHFEDPTATLMLQVQTIERFSRSLRVVGFALLALFLDPKSGGQPVSRSIQDFVLNQGGFQIPLHAGAPPTAAALRASSLDGTPRLPCSSLLVRILSPEAAKLQRRRPPPAYADRVYDTVSRCLPSSLERLLFSKVLARRAVAVRETARLVAWFRRQQGGLGGRRTLSATRRANDGGGLSANQQQGVAAGGSGFLARVFGGGGDDDAAAAAAAAAAHLNTGDPSAAHEELQADLEQAKAELLPPSDPEIMDWMADVMAEAEAAALTPTPRPGPSAAFEAAPGLSFINYNTASEYCEDLGFFVALDGACRLSRLLPTAGLMSYSPPGSLYQDQPLVDDVKLTMDYDLDAPLAGPCWLDGYQQFAGVPYTPGLVMLADVRCVVPGSGSSSPAGWACLPVFERAGRFVASGTYQLPLFQGVPSQQLLSELEARGDPDAAMAAAIASGRVRPSLEASSVLVRLMCGSRQGQLEIPAWRLPLQELRLPRYVVSELGPRFVGEMRKVIKNKTYSQAKPKALTDEQWVDQINDTLIKVAGLDEGLQEDPSQPGSPLPEQQPGLGPVSSHQQQQPARLRASQASSVDSYGS